MVDRLSKQQRSIMMSKIKGKDTKFEVMVRKYLFRNGFRFRKNDSRYPGKPDIVLPKYNTIIFINGCFWHRHKNCKLSYMPKSNIEFWQKKFSINEERDCIHYEKLRGLGFNIIVVWECELRKNFEQRMKKLIDEIKVNECI